MLKRILAVLLTLLIAQVLVSAKIKVKTSNGLVNTRQQLEASNRGGARHIKYYQDNKFNRTTSWYFRTRLSGTKKYKIF